MTMMKTTYTLLLCALILQVSKAQDITDEKLSVRKTFVSQDIDVKPLTGLFTSSATQNFGALEVSQDSLLSFGAPSIEISADIEPLAYQQPRVDEGSYGHLMATAGTLNPLALQGALFHKVDNYFSVQANAAYDNWNDKSIVNKQFNKVEGSLNTSYYVTDHSEFKLSLNGRSTNQGAFSDLNRAESQDTIRIRHFSVSMDYRSFHDDIQSFDYGLNVNYSTTRNNFIDNTENLWIITPHLSKGLSQELRIHAQSKNYVPMNFGTTSDLVSNNNLGLVWNKQQLTLNIGGTLNRTIDRTTLYPAVKANFYFSPDNHVSISVQENINYQGLNRTTSANPFLNNTFDQPFATRVREHAIALRNDVTDRVKVSAQLSRNFYIDDINWELSDENRRFFEVDRIDYDAWIANLSVAVEAHPLIDVSTSFTKNIYNSESVLLYRPEHTLNIGTTFHTADRKFEASLTGNLSDRQITDVLATGLQVSSGFRYDLGVSLNYRPMDLLTVQLNGTNLLNNEFEVLRGYDNFSRNLSASVLLKF